MTRPRRTASVNINQAITVARVPSPESSKRSIRLTVKMPSSKLREATSGPTKPVTSNTRRGFEPAAIVTGPRGSRAKRAVVIESGSDEDEDEGELDQVDSEEDEEIDEGEDDGEADDDENEDGDEGDEDQEDVDAEGEIEADVDDDTEMIDVVPPTNIRIKGPTPNPSLVVTPAENGPIENDLQSGSEDDEELSELESAEPDGGDIGDDTAEVDDIEEDMEQNEEVDSDEDITGSRRSTPDISQLTKRQRNKLYMGKDEDLMFIPMGSSTPNAPSHC